jgi:hypothetical protein
MKKAKIMRGMADNYAPKKVQYLDAMDKLGNKMDRDGQTLDSRKKVEPEETESDMDNDDPESTISDQYDVDVTIVSSIGKTKRAVSP